MFSLWIPSHCLFVLRRFSYNPAHNRTGLLAFGVLGNICDGLSDRKRKTCTGCRVSSRWRESAGWCESHRQNYTLLRSEKRKFLKMLDINYSMLVRRCIWLISCICIICTSLEIGFTILYVNVINSQMFTHINISAHEQSWRKGKNKYVQMWHLSIFGSDRSPRRAGRSWISMSESVWNFMDSSFLKGVTQGVIQG